VNEKMRRNLFADTAIYLTSAGGPLCEPRRASPPEAAPLSVAIVALVMRGAKKRNRAVVAVKAAAKVT